MVATDWDRESEVYGLVYPMVSVGVSRLDYAESGNSCSLVGKQYNLYYCNCTGSQWFTDCVD